MGGSDMPFIEEKKLLIPDITTQTKNWTVRVTVSEIIPTMRCTTGSKLKRYVLTDIEGNQVLGSLYDPDLDILSPMIHLYAVYDISNADVKVANQKYQILENPFHWIIKRQTLIEPVPNATPNLHYLVRGITPLGLLPEASTRGQITADIMGVVIDSDEITQIKSGNNKVQHFTVIDSNMFPVRISLWDDTISVHGPMLVQAAMNNSIIIAKRMALRKYDSISLSPRNSSSIAIDPPLQIAEEIKAWFHCIPPSELQTLRTRKTTSFTKDLVCAGKVNTYRVADLAKVTKTGDYWSRGYLRLLEQDQQLYYIACSECRSKVKAELGKKYYCLLCSKDVVAILRPLVVLTLMDQSGTLDIAAIDEVAERVLHTTTKELEELHKSGSKLDLHSVREEIKATKYLMCLSKTPANDRMLLRSYTTENEQPIRGSSSSCAQLSIDSHSSLPPYEKEPNLALSPLKRQLNSITLSAGGSSTKRQLMLDQVAQKMHDEGGSTKEN